MAESLNTLSTLNGQIILVIVGKIRYRLRISSDKALLLKSDRS